MAQNKTAGAMIYVQEELSDARLRCDELKHYMVKVLDLIHSSGMKDQIYAAAGDVIHAAPNALMRLEKALGATALAINKMDYEELRQVLRPEKVDELERVLEDLRIRIPRRRGEVLISKPDFQESPDGK
jgi:hypothetical protein